ncbi:aspartate/glutamate racemase family protein [Actinomadura viridis]|uniref:aspartate/glutamate racemase family protein n=1 Tax=Actinomadura viridis TaxID=58110 RepID=UPI0036C2DA5E
MCFLTFCRRGFEDLGPHMHPDVTLDCVAMGHSMQAWEDGDHPAIREVLATSVRRLAKAGADFFVCPDNTAHLALEAPGPELALPGLHIAEVVAERAALEGRRRVGVLGTKYLMGGTLYPRALAAHGIECRLPEAADRLLVDEIIFEELVNGVFTDRARREYVRIIEGFEAEGCDAVALVCTEIPLLITPEVSPLPTLPSTTLLASAAYETATGKRPLPTWRSGPFHPEPGSDRR